MLNIVGKRYWYFGLSLLIIIPGLISLILFGLRLSIDLSLIHISEPTRPY